MAELFKFRCYQCQKLIGAPPSRFGKVVKCPKCEAELIVPSPEGPEAETEADDADGVRPDELGIKLEPERLAPPKPAPIAKNVLDPVGPDPIAFLSRASGDGEQNFIEGELLQTDDGESSNEPIPTDALPEVRAEPLVERNRGPLIRSEPLPRARDVVLPRTAATAYALFGLLGLAFAFTAGLLLGHFLWK